MHTLLPFCAKLNSTSIEGLISITTQTKTKPPRLQTLPGRQEGRQAGRVAADADAGGRMDVGERGWSGERSG